MQSLCASFYQSLICFIFSLLESDLLFWGGPESHCLLPYPPNPYIFLKKRTEMTDIAMF